MRTILKLAVACVLLLPLGPGMEQVVAADRPAPTDKPALVVVELFTSQGCSSCPPADALLTKLANRDGILALGFHVDYWDYIGWKDPFSDPAYTQRQRDYAGMMSGRYVYTPQIVVQGAWESVGTDEALLETRIVKARNLPRVPLDLTYDKAAHTVTLSIPQAVMMESHAVWLVLYDEEHTTHILRGENGGRTLTYSHVVRSLRRLGNWQGEAMAIPIDLSAMGVKPDQAYACTVLLQARETGRILGAANLELPAGH